MGTLLTFLTSISASPQRFAPLVTRPNLSEIRHPKAQALIVFMVMKGYDNDSYEKGPLVLLLPVLPAFAQKLLETEE